jgi:hypothetical protein
MQKPSYGAEHFTGKLWIKFINPNHDVAGRTLEQVRSTFNRIERGEAWFDSLGIGHRINTVFEMDGSVTFESV